MNSDNASVLRDGASFALVDGSGNAFGLVDGTFFYQQKTSIHPSGETSVADILGSTGKNRVEFSADTLDVAISDNAQLIVTTTDEDVHLLDFADSEVPLTAINAVKETSPSAWKVAEEQNSAIFAYFFTLIHPALGAAGVALLGWLLWTSTSDGPIQGAVGRNRGKAKAISALAQAIGPIGVLALIAVGVVAVAIWFRKAASNVKREYLTLSPEQEA